ncbi:50S ribosomal protein L17 [Candidatus Rubidus massiliensis]|mgnify:FL=1|nr:MAG: 50S ribosomal protein L17 [Chlamydia sp. 32-24]CDZ80484.1 50S ribosomal protein L17 [Candidatus Rubidus massiliensis]
MRHLKDTCKLNRTSSHRRCMFANMLKSLIINGKIETTVPKAKALRRYADKMITLAKQNSLASRRRAISELMIRYNTLTAKEARDAKNGDTSSYNDDRQVIDVLFNDLGTRFASRNGGYTRITRYRRRVGDNAQTCFIEYLAS